MGIRNSKLRESQRGRIFELAAIVVTASGKFILGDVLNLDLFYVVFTCVFWIGYVLLRHRWEPGVLERWGFTRHGIGDAVRMVAPVAAVLLAGFVIYGLVSGRAAPNWNTLILMGAYPVWGTIQQFMVVALLADNIAALSRERVPEWVASLIAAVSFALIHLPVLPLAVAVLVLGMITTTLFFRTRTIWVPGVLHGWFATIFYVFVLGQDPLRDIVSLAFAL